MRSASPGFKVHAVYALKKPSILHVAKQKLSFAIATFTLLSFVMGNMVGQHGWYSFWKSVLGKEDDSLIAFVGTVPPIAKIPDYAEWAKYGGNKELHTFREVPQQVLRDLPAYDPVALANGTADMFARQAYSTLWAGGYNGPEGSHAGVDIDAPRGTPLVSIANGVVEKVSLGNVGFGHYVVIRHPNVPDASKENGVTTLRSTYAHMDGVIVEEGQVVHKGEAIGTVGNTGLVFGATGYHLYFEVDRDNAPYHPYWPFTTAEAAQNKLSFVQAVDSTMFRGRVLQYTVNPMQFTEQYRNFVPVVAVAQTQISSAATVSSIPANLTPGQHLKAFSARRAQQRIARLPATVVAQISSKSSSSMSSSSAPAAEIVSQVVTAETVNTGVTPSGESNTDVDHIGFEHSGKLSRTWQKVKVISLDRDGNIVRSPSFPGRLYLVSDFGEAEIRPDELSPLDFQNGVAIVNVLTRSLTKPVFIGAKGAFNNVSAPMVPVR